MIRARKTGSGWTEALDWIRWAKDSLQATAEGMLKVIAEETADDLKTAIEAQTLPLAPLSPGYLAWKAYMGRDTRILIAFGFYVWAITAFEMGKWVWAAGWQEAIHPPSGLPYSRLWAFLEYGTAKIPARPHVAPIAARALKKFPQLIRDSGFKYVGKV